MQKKFEKLTAILESQPLMPVLRIERLADAVPLVRALVAGGLPAVEITLRTPDAIDAIRLVANEVPEAIVGAGTILTPRAYDAAADAGARFIVSPGTTQELLDVARGAEVPFLPGATTPSEIMALREEGYSILKFFPAEQSGGRDFLKSVASPLAGIRFCPTGGISLANAKDYLSLPNVICVGGTWVAPDAAISEGDWGRITSLAHEASELKASA